MERQPSVFLRRSLKCFLWFCFVFVRVFFAKKGLLAKRFRVVENQKSLVEA
jgi:hypothetical protein